MLRAGTFRISNAGSRIGTVAVYNDISTKVLTLKKISRYGGVSAKPNTVGLVPSLSTMTSR